MNSFATQMTCVHPPAVKCHTLISLLFIMHYISYPPSSKRTGLYVLTQPVRGVLDRTNCTVNSCLLELKLSKQGSGKWQKIKTNTECMRMNIFVWALRPPVLCCVVNREQGLGQWLSQCCWRTHRSQHRGSPTAFHLSLAFLMGLKKSFQHAIHVWWLYWFFFPLSSLPLSLSLSFHLYYTSISPLSSLHSPSRAATVSQSLLVLSPTLSLSLSSLLPATISQGCK